MQKVILISGKQGSGKSTLGAELQKLNPRIRVVKFAGPLYALGNLVYDHLRLAYQLPLNKDDAAFKRLLQLVGTEWGRETVEDLIWVKCAQNMVSGGMWHPDTIFAFDDCRFENELAAFPDAVKVRLIADRDDRRARADRWRDDENHPSETALDGLDKNAFDLTAYTGASGWPAHVVADMVLELVERKYGKA